MVGRHLDQGLGVTYKVLEGEENMIYIEEVEKNKEIHFFRFPRLGSYAAIGIFYKDYLGEECYSKGV